MFVLVGCGGGSSTSTGAASAKRKAPPASRYRSGQFCFMKRQAEYRAGGFTCTSKHQLKKIP